MLGETVQHCPECLESWIYDFETFDSYAQRLWVMDRIVLQHLLDSAPCRVLLDRLAVHEPS